MNDLLALAMTGHGGLYRWKAVKSNFRTASPAAKRLGLPEVPAVTIVDLDEGGVPLMKLWMLIQVAIFWQLSAQRRQASTHSRM